MAAQEIIEATRKSLAPVGFSMPSIGLTTVPAVDLQRAAVRRLEKVGYQNGWANEGVGAKDVFVQLAILLAETERMVFGTSVSPMWARPPMVAHAASRQLAEAYPGRFVLGLGAGYDFMASMVGLEYGSPLRSLRTYVSRMPEPTPVVEAPPVNYATLLAANGPKSITQAVEIADGVLPTLIPPAYTRQIRSILGPDKLLVVGLTAFIDDDEAAARAAASANITRSLGFPQSPYARNLERLGYTEQERTDGSRRLIDDITAYGSPGSVAAAVRRHLDAGADHVILQPVAATFAEVIDRLEKVAVEVTAIRRSAS
ncbi:LLM class flavin-dependent oxidoreductase [Mycobacterium sp. NPDC003449]